MSTEPCRKRAKTEAADTCAVPPTPVSELMARASATLGDTAFDVTTLARIRWIPEPVWDELTASADLYTFAARLRRATTGVHQTLLSPSDLYGTGIPLAVASGPPPLGTPTPLQMTVDNLTKPGTHSAETLAASDSLWSKHIVYWNTYNLAIICKALWWQGIVKAVDHCTGIALPAFRVPTPKALRAASEIQPLDDFPVAVAYCDLYDDFADVSDFDPRCGPPRRGLSELVSRRSEALRKHTMLAACGDNESTTQLLLAQFAQDLTLARFPPGSGGSSAAACGGSLPGDPILGTYGAAGPLELVTHITYDASAEPDAGLPCYFMRSNNSHLPPYGSTPREDHSGYADLVLVPHTVDYDDEAGEVSITKCAECDHLVTTNVFAGRFTVTVSGKEPMTINVFDGHRWRGSSGVRLPYRTLACEHCYDSAVASLPTSKATLRLFLWADGESGEWATHLRLAAFYRMQRGLSYVPFRQALRLKPPPSDYYTFLREHKAMLPQAVAQALTV